MGRRRGEDDALLVTVVVPVRDEATRIADCIAAIAAQDIPQSRIEVLVVDGGSRDATVAVATEALSQCGFSEARVLHSDEGSRPGNLNAGLAQASASMLCRVDARSRIPAHYLRTCCETLARRPEVAVVGGTQRAVAPSDAPLHVGIARALNNRWTMGGARYRRALASGPADTVYLGAFRTAQLRAAGGWRLDLTVNEDFDINRRMARHGIVWFDSSLVVDYVPRETLPALVRQYGTFGRSKARYWRLTGDRPQRRQLALLTAPAAASALAATVLSRATPAWRAVAVGAAVGGLVATEARGSTAPRASLQGHASAMAAMLCVGGGWLGGVWLELLRPAADRTWRR